MRKGLLIQLANSFFSLIGINGSSIRMMTRTGNVQNTMTKPTLKLIFEDLENIENYVSGGMKTYYRALVEEMYKWQGDIKNISKNVSLKNYVIIIDEINRGNVSQIFGELITLIEEDKRIGKDEALEVTLAYSKVGFGVPSNLFIIGTMNTADRSVEALDSALRRRFSFFEMPPTPELIATHGKLKDANGIVNNINLPSLLITINKRIEKLLDKDHQIGHSYFMSVATIVDLKHSFQYKIVPLLQEYFFGDIGKIGLILGKDFFEEMPGSQQPNIFADFDAYDASEFSDRSIFKIKNLNTLSDEGFTKAINTLLGKN
jgi:5-methylcytosine-specific restriction enzyme B